ncbi:MAG: S8 family serine peptidase [Aquabacterium sp.]
MRTRFFKLAMQALAIWMLLVGQGAAWADDPPKMARGWIVKLKDGATRVSVVRLRANQVPVDSAVLRGSLASVVKQLPERSRDYRRTAFAAHLFGRKRLVTLAQAEAQAAILRRNPNVEWVVVNEVVHPASTFVGSPVVVNDPDYGAQTWLQPRDASHLAVANIPAAWHLLEGLTLTPVVVAVLDSGILPASDLYGRVLPGYDFVSEIEASHDGNGQDSDPTDPGDWLTQAEKDGNPALYAGCEVHDSSWHGLAVTSMLGEALNSDSGAGILAPFPGPVVLPVRVSGVCGASVSDMIEGMLWAAGVDYHGAPTLNPNPARVINISFGGDGSCADPTVGSVGWLYRQTVDQLRSMGVVVAASAGNGDAAGNGLPNLTRPANCPGVLAVTGLNMRGYKAVYANLVDAGKDYAVAVATGDGTFNPGTKQWTVTDGGIATLTNLGTTVPNSSYAQRSLLGTSFGAPTAVGVAALMLAANPSLTADEVMHALTTEVSAFPDATTVVGGALQCNAGSSTVPSGCMPACDASRTDLRGNCYCTTSTCGGGVLDAEKAVQWAISHPGSSTYHFAYAYAGYFTPDRLKPATQTTSHSGGGGGALDDGSLLALLFALATLMAVRVRSGRR